MVVIRRRIVISQALRSNPKGGQDHNQLKYGIKENWKRLTISHGVSRNHLVRTGHDDIYFSFLLKIGGGKTIRGRWSNEPILCEMRIDNKTTERETRCFLSSDTTDSYTLFFFWKKKKRRGAQQLFWLHESRCCSTARELGGGGGTLRAWGAFRAGEKKAGRH